MNKIPTAASGVIKVGFWPAKFCLLTQGLCPRSGPYLGKQFAGIISRTPRRDIEFVQIGTPKDA